MQTNGYAKDSSRQGDSGDSKEDPEPFKPTWQSSRRIGRTFWRVTGAYWRSEERGAATGLLLLIVIGILCRVLTVVTLNNTSGNFFNSLQNKDQAAFYRNSMLVALLLTVQLAMIVLHTFCSQMLQIRWRRWLTSHYVGLWLANQAFYRLRFHGRLDNPDQRISEDIRILLADTLDLMIGLLNTTLTVGAFAGVLYGLSGPMHLAFLGIQLNITGYLFWVSIVYWAVGAALGYLVGNPLIWLTNRQQKLEADFRFALIRVREKAEAIALYGGHEVERSRTQGAFGFVNRNSIRILFRTAKLLVYQTFITDAPSPLSFILCAPRFFAGIITLGDMMKSANGFGQMSSSLSWVVNAYPTFADWHATVDRLAEFQQDLAEISMERSDLEISYSVSPHIVLTDVCAYLPEGQPIISNLSATLAQGEAVLFKGRSGSGKSTLFRVLAGIWPFSSGHIQIPLHIRSLLLPQQPFVPIGPLRTALWFPDAADAGRDGEALTALEAVNLSHLSSRLDEHAHWEQILSPGEQQRLAICQALLFKPEWLFLDEATSALDEEQEASVYKTLIKLLPQTTIISIGHRSTLEDFHHRTIVLSPPSQSQA